MSEIGMKMNRKSSGVARHDQVVDEQATKPSAHHDAHFHMDISHLPSLFNVYVTYNTAVH